MSASLSQTLPAPTTPDHAETSRLAALRCLGRLGLESLRRRCSPLEALNRLVPADTHRHLEGFAYGDHTRQALDLYLPLGEAPA